MTRKQKKMLLRILLTGALLLVLQLLPLTGALRFGAYMALYLLIGYDILWKALRGIWNRQVFDECFLMAIATVGAIGLALYSRSGDYLEAISVMLFYQIGEWFQSYAVGKSRRNISALMDIRPDYANVEKNGTLVQVDPEEVEPGTLIFVQPGEKIPIDGLVLEGNATLNTSALTGESLPRDVGPGDTVISGCINMTGLLKVRTTKAFEDSTVSKILELVENATSRKSKSEAFISRFAQVYTPAVCAAALALALLPPVGSLLLGADPQWGVWVYRALAFLVSSCPCALVISIPLSFFAGIGGASRVGVLIKGSNYLETLSQVRTLVFDKTGTLTQGAFEVKSIFPGALSSQELLEIAAHAECASSHPISKSLQRAYAAPIDRSRVTDIREESGGGVLARVDGIAVVLGNEKLMRRLQIPVVPCQETGTVVYVAVDGQYGGCILIADRLKPTAAQALETLKKAGIKKTVMLTGDSQAVAQQVAQELGVSQVHAQLLPDQKVQILEQLLQSKDGKLAFVGDGINDAPVLGRADIGIAMGAMGSDAAIEAADVVLMDDDPMQIATAIGISRKTLAIVYQNIFFAIGIKAACLLLVALGLGDMWLAIFADVGVMVLAVLNATRALFVKKYPKTP